MGNSLDRVFANGYADKILAQKHRNAGKKTIKDRSKMFREHNTVRAKPIDRHDDYDGTDVGFTTDSIEKPIPKTKMKRKKPIDRHGNYEGTDVGFTSKHDK